MMARTDCIDAYVLGTMEDAERTDFEHQMRADTALAAEVASLATRLMALDETAEPMPASAVLWSRIEARLDITEPAAPAIPAAAPMPANDNRGRFAPWLTAASVLVALGVGLLGGTVIRSPEPQPIVIAVLANNQSAPGAIVEAYGNDRVRIVPLEMFTAEADRVFEVWTLPASADGPVSLGTFSQAQDMILEGPDLPTPESGQLYEITLEPAGGSPIGRPTGPVVYIGRAQQPVV